MSFISAVHTRYQIIAKKVTQQDVLDHLNQTISDDNLQIKPDIIHAITKFSVWEFENIPISKIWIYGDSHVSQPMESYSEEDEELCHKYADMKSASPPIIVHKLGSKYATIDGGHRARAAWLKKQQTIPAYVAHG